MAVLAPSTKAKIRNVMSVLFNHAIRYEWLEQGKNPILLVRQGPATNHPRVLEPEELRALLFQLDHCFRVMVLLDAATGLRRSELLALKWEDIDFERLQINLRRSIYLNVVGNCKTEASRKPVPLDLTLASELWTWKQDSAYGQPNDWAFASPHSQGRNPYWPDILLFRVVRPAAARAGIRKHIGWHTFPAQLFDHADGERRKRESGAGTHASCELPVHTGDLFSGSATGEARRAASGS